MAEGDVEAIDLSEQSITLKHGPIRSRTIEMGPMIMPFTVQKPSLLTNVKIGDKVRFTAEYINGTVTITTLQRIR